MSLPAKRPYYEYWTPYGHLLIDEEVLDDLVARDFHPGRIGPNEYPDVRDSSGRAFALLHSSVDSYYVRAGVLPPLPPGTEIHHVRGNKLDARLRQLQRLTKEEHSQLTWRQKPNTKKKRHFDVQGLWHPYAPGPVRTDESLIGKTRALVEPTAVKKGEWTQEDRELEIELWSRLDNLRSRTKKLKPESALSIPPEAEQKKYRNWRVRREKLKKSRRGCTPGEAALVFALILSAFDRRCTAQLVSVHVEQVEALMKRTSVAQAIQRWQTLRRYPKPCPQSLKKCVGSRATSYMRDKANERAERRAKDKQVDDLAKTFSSSSLPVRLEWVVRYQVALNGEGPTIANGYGNNDPHGTINQGTRSDPRDFFSGKFSR